MLIAQPWMSYGTWLDIKSEKERKRERVFYCFHMPQFLRPFHFPQMQCRSIIETCLCLTTHSRLMGFHVAGHTNEFLECYSRGLNVFDAQGIMRTLNSEISPGFLWKLAKFRFHILLTYWLSAWSCWNRFSECGGLLQNRHIDIYISRHFLVA